MNNAEFLPCSPAPLQVLPVRYTMVFTPAIVGGPNAGAGAYTSLFETFPVVDHAGFFAINIMCTNHTGTGDLLIGALPFSSLWNLQKPVSVFISLLPFTDPVVQA
jgi:hypothetical protein